jgi:sporadic carbohydrate cluster protein (TIGR04323 family)
MSNPGSIPQPRHGLRGYITARPILGNRVPQHVQNLVIRDYAQRHGLTFKLSATEYAMPRCFMILEGVLQELPGLEGIIVYSLFMLPPRARERRALYQRILDGDGVLHCAVEGLVLRGDADIGRFEDIWLLQQAIDLSSAGPAVREWHRNAAPAGPQI